MSVCLSTNLSFGEVLKCQLFFICVSVCDDKPVGVSVFLCVCVYICLCFCGYLFVCPCVYLSYYVYVSLFLCAWQQLLVRLYAFYASVCMFVFVTSCVSPLFLSVCVSAFIPCPISMIEKSTICLVGRRFVSISSQRKPKSLIDARKCYFFHRGPLFEVCWRVVATEAAAAIVTESPFLFRLTNKKSFVSVQLNRLEPRPKKKRVPKSEAKNRLVYYWVSFAF